MIAAWVLAFEPSNVFFSTLLHKEPNLLLAGGLVAFGGASMWKSARLQYLWPITLGCLVAVATRPYAGWFLIAAGAAITLHVGIRARTEGARSLTLVALVVLLGAISAPTVWEASTDKSLEQNLQSSQDANASDDSNLSLERVDFQPGGDHRQPAEAHRRRDHPPLPVAARQYQPASSACSARSSPSPASGCSPSSSACARPRHGSSGTAGLCRVLHADRLLAFRRQRGTAFRYRMHVVALAICLLVVLRELRLHPAPAPAPARAPGREPAPTPSLAGV